MAIETTGFAAASVRGTRRHDLVVMKLELYFFLVKDRVKAFSTSYLIFIKSGILTELDDTNSFGSVFLVSYPKIVCLKN